LRVGSARGKDPLSLVRFAAEERGKAEAAARRSGDDGERFDEVWCVVDVDDHTHLPAARELARREGISLAVSNPCFELWALLHFEDQRAHLHRDTLKQRLRRHLPSYTKHLDCDRLWHTCQDALRRAQDLDRLAEADDQPGRNPTTGVWPLVDQLIHEAGFREKG
jgi:hypothetical protein